LIVAVGWASCVAWVAYELAVRTDDGTHPGICNGIQCPSGFECRQQEFGKKCVVIEDSGGDVLYVALALLLGVPGLCVIPVGCSFCCKRSGQAGRWQNLETHGIDSPKKKRRQSALGKRHGASDSDAAQDTGSTARNNDLETGECDNAASSLLESPTACAAGPKSSGASGGVPAISRRPGTDGVGVGLMEGGLLSGQCGSEPRSGEDLALTGAGPFDARIDVDTRMPESDQDFEDGEASDATSSEQASDLDDLFHVRPSQAADDRFEKDTGLGVSPEKIGRGDEETGSLLSGGDSGLFAISPGKPRRGQSDVAIGREDASPPLPQGDGGLWNMFFGSGPPEEPADVSMPSARGSLQRGGLQGAGQQSQAQAMGLPVSDALGMADASPSTTVPPKTPSDLFGLSPEKGYEEVES